MPLGNPIRKQNESRMVSVLATEGQTVFTVQGGYIINHISVFRNGVRLSPAEDFTAGDGSTVTLNNAANIDDRIDFHIFDRFTVQNAIVSAASTQTISGDVVVNGKIFGNLDVPQINVASGIVTTHDLNVTGIVTATELDLNGKGDISGDLNVVGVTTVGKQVHVGTGVSIAAGGLNVTAGISTFGGNIKTSSSNIILDDSGGASDDRLVFGAGSDLSLYHTGSHSFIEHSGTGHLIIGGVPNGTNVDIMKAGFGEYMARFKPDSSVDLYYNANVRFNTTPSGADITGTLNVTGISTLTGDVSIADKIVHTGDTDTAIRFPSANQISFETGGNERARVDTGGRLLHGVNTNTPVASTAGANLQVHNNASVITASFTGYGAHAGGSVVCLGKSRSNTIGDATGAVSNGDTLGDIRFGGSDGTDMHNTSAQILGQVDGSVSSDSIPGRLIFQTNSGSGNVERLRINSDGAVAILDGSASAARFSIGNGSDLKIFHTNPSSYIQDGSSALIISSARIDLNSTGGESMARFYTNGQVELYHNNVERLETLSNGVQIFNQLFVSEGTISLEKAGVHHHRIIANDTGNDLGFQQSSDTGSNTNFTTYLRINDGGNISLPVDNQKLRLGASGDLQIFHDGNSKIQNVNNSCDFRLISNSIELKSQSGDEYFQKCTVDGAVSLYYDNVEKLATFAQGVDVVVSGNSGLRIRGNVADVDPRIVFRRKNNDGNNSEPAAIQMTYLAGTTHESGHLDFFTNGDSGSAALTRRLRIRNDGALLVNTTTQTSLGSHTGASNVVTVNRSGIVLTAYSVIAGFYYDRLNFNNSQYFIVNSSGTGVYLGSGNTSWTAHSDERLKINITELDGTKAYNHVKTARASSFNWNATGYPTDKKIGFIAQDWETNYPEVVNTSTETVDSVENPKGIQYTETVPVLMAALKEAISKIETLETKVAALEGS